MPKSAETGDVVDNRSAVAVDKTQSVFVISNSNGMTMKHGTDSVPCFVTLLILK